VLDANALACVYGRDMSTKLLSDIDDFLAETGMGAFRFGLLAAKNGRLVERLRAGTTGVRRKPVLVRPETEQRIRDFMAVQRAKKADAA
jgi:hypothetical protein